MSSYIEDLIGDIEHNMKSVKIADPYFEQLSIEKFTMKYLLQQIGSSDESTPTGVIVRFVQKMNDYVFDTFYQSNNYTFSVARDVAQDILDSLYFYDLYER